MSGRHETPLLFGRFVFVSLTGSSSKDIVDESFADEIQQALLGRLFRAITTSLSFWFSPSGHALPRGGALPRRGLGSRRSGGRLAHVPVGRADPGRSRRSPRVRFGRAGPGRGPLVRGRTWPCRSTLSKGRSSTLPSAGTAPCGRHDLSMVCCLKKECRSYLILSLFETPSY